MGGHKAQAQSMSGHKNRTGIKFCDRCAHICSQHAHLLRLRGGPRAQGGEIDLRLQGGAARLRRHARGDRQRGGGRRLGAGPQDLQEEPGRHPFIEKSTGKMAKKIRIFLPEWVSFRSGFWHPWTVAHSPKTSIMQFFLTFFLISALFEPWTCHWTVLFKEDP